MSTPAAQRRCRNARRRVEKKNLKNRGGAKSSADRRAPRAQRVEPAAQKASARGPVHDQPPVPPPPAAGTSPTPPHAAEVPFAGVGSRCCFKMCKDCFSEFKMSANAVAHFKKKGWKMRVRCYACTAEKKKASAEWAKQRKQQRQQPGAPRPEPPAVAGVPPKQHAEVVSENGGTWSAEAAGAVAAVDAVDCGVADVFVGPARESQMPARGTYISSAESARADLEGKRLLGLHNILEEALWNSHEDPVVAVEYLLRHLRKTMGLD